MPKDAIKPITMTERSAATFTGNYLAINGGGLTYPCVLMRVINDTNKDLTISYDGVNPHDYVRSGSTIELNFQTNSRPNNKVAEMPKGTVVYVAAASGTGYVYLAGYYIPRI